jgi:hypothetical protein
VEVIYLTGTSGKRDGEWLRVSYLGFHVADVRTLEELASYFPLDSLEEKLTRRYRLNPWYAA